jgi:hypothetical protein
MFLLATLLMGPQSNQRGSTKSGSDWSWLTGSGRQSRQTSPAATSWLWGYPTKASQPGKKHGWLI